VVLTFWEWTNQVGLSSELRKLLTMNVVAQVIYIYIGIFINLYIWEGGKKISDVVVFNMSLYVGWSIGFTLGAHLMTRYSIRLVFAVSAIAGLVVFTSLSFLHLDNRIVWIVLIGAFVGLTFGSFYAAHNLSISLSGQVKDLGSYYSYVNIFQQISSVTVPITSALIIQWFGYPGSFLMMLIIVTAMLALSRLVPNLSLSHVVKEEGEWYKGMAYGKLFRNRSDKWLNGAFFATGMFIQFQNLFVLLFTFHVTENKLLIALLNTAYTLSAFTALYLYRRIRLSENTWMVLGMSFVSAGFLISIAYVSPLLVVSNILSTVGMIYFNINWMIKVYRSVNHLSPMGRLRMLVWRECIICLSRCCMLLVLFFLDDIRGPMFAGIVVLTVICVYLIRFCLLRYEHFSVKEATEGAIIKTSQ